MADSVVSAASLEELQGGEALEWVRQQNERVEAHLGDIRSQPLFHRLVRQLENKPELTKINQVLNGLVYNFCQATAVWRRCSIYEFQKAETQWECLLDVKQAFGESWEWAGFTVYDAHPSVPIDLALISLSRRGSEQVLVREFSLVTLDFVKHNGFELREAMNQVCYRDRDTLLVGTDFGPGSLTKFGFPRTSRLWRRGTPLSDAQLVFEGESDDVIVDQSCYRDHDRLYELRTRVIDDSTVERYVRWSDCKDGPGLQMFKRIPAPASAEVYTFQDQLILTLRAAWDYYPGHDGFKSGTLLALDLNDFVAWGQNSDTFAPPPATVLFEPTNAVCFENMVHTQTCLVLSVLENVHTQLVVWRYNGSNWNLAAKHRAPTGVMWTAAAYEGDRSDSILISSTGYVHPPSLSLMSDVIQGDSETLKAIKPQFSATGLEVLQYEATSLDGTQVPYFIVGPKDKLGAYRLPTLLYGYGGFEIALTPAYAATLGAGWLEHGASTGQCYAVANIRGGGEFGSGWHQKALKGKKHKAIEDFEAVARDLCRRRITSPNKLGIQGGSNGGLIVVNVMLRSPHLFGALVCDAPLLDMRRYPMLNPAAQDWIDEYGDPDNPDEWELLRHMSPLHNVDPQEQYPPMLLTAATESNVHPAHARKFVYKLLQGKNDGTGTILYHENKGQLDNVAQRAYKLAVIYTFLKRNLNVPTDQLVSTQTQIARKSNQVHRQFTARKYLRTFTNACRERSWIAPTIIGTTALFFHALVRYRRRA